MNTYEFEIVQIRHLSMTLQLTRCRQELLRRAAFWNHLTQKNGPCQARPLPPAALSAVYVEKTRWKWDEKVGRGMETQTGTISRVYYP